MKQRIIQRSTSVSPPKVDAQHLLRQHPAILSIDLDACPLIEHRFIIAVVFKKLHIHRPLPFRLEILHIDSGIRVPEMIGVSDQ